jgi:hypothetical protein
VKRFYDLPFWFQIVLFTITIFPIIVALNCLFWVQLHPTIGPVCTCVESTFADYFSVFDLDATPR